MTTYADLMQQRNKGSLGELESSLAFQKRLENAAPNDRTYLFEDVYAPGVLRDLIPHKSMRKSEVIQREIETLRNGGQPTREYLTELLEDVKGAEKFYANLESEVSEHNKRHLQDRVPMEAQRQGARMPSEVLAKEREILEARLESMYGIRH